MSKLRPEIKQLWVDALRSGKYEQAQYRLRKTDNTFCCLGVLCDIYKKRRHRGKWVKNRVNEFKFETRPNEDALAGSVSPTIEAWATTNGGSLPFMKLISMNDVQKKPFTEIANYIEKAL